MPSGGQTLPKQTQKAMGARFGHDFSQVRVHTDNRAGQTAEALGANAFTLGQDIVFGAGRYAPGSAAGDRLLAHELTHVVQQDRWGGPGSEGQISRWGDASEQEADSVAHRIASGQSVDVMAAPGALIARDEAEGAAGEIGVMAGAALGDAAGASLGPSDAPPAGGDPFSLQQQMGQEETMMQAMSGMLQSQQGMEKSVINNMGI